ncbi:MULTISPECIES: cyclase family protein [Microbacterium]|uniref:cyclase family protein n=1 Tax=Microbacterium TaxID=33882 RepID=UPI002781623C|nr:MULTISPECIES: cyclase family protein [Microbacterium]MDQ1082726.1 kynurenine formamidase [Microbacterium sp. SORGH_AS_0344]MDQ1168503.1 kynurenine formamidase [Microbacterium proteolyticum]
MTDTSAARQIRATEPIDQADFDELYERLKQWDTWSDPERGAWNRLTPAHAAAAAATVRSGRVVQTTLPWPTEPEIDNRRPAMHMMLDLGDREAPEPSTNKDFIGIEYHGKSTTHLDALSHIAYRGELFGGARSRDVVNATGAGYGSVAKLGSFVGRGVLIDMPVVKGFSWLEPGEAVYEDDLREAEQVLGVSIGDADAVLLRTGHKARRSSLGPWDSSDLSAGLHATAMPLLAERGIALLGSDGDSDVRPSPTPGIHSPVHILALTALGVPLLDNLDLEQLSVVAAEENRYEFLFTVAPLLVPAGTGSPVNPTAVF